MRARQHRRREGREAEGQLSGDLCGPIPPGIGGEKYLAALVKHDTHYVYAKGIVNKRAATMKEAAADMGIELKTVWRFHLDAGSECPGALCERLKEYEVHQSNTGGYDPQANGLAESVIGEVIGGGSHALAPVGCPDQVVAGGCDALRGDPQPHKVEGGWGQPAH